jgi:predicted SprT family Zn-dependent metalloprotease
MRTGPTERTHAQLQAAFDHINKDPFGNALPKCAITFRRGRYRVYYAMDRCEIALNPDHLADGTEAVLSHLLHGMVHLWQRHFGKPGRGAYHNAEFAEMMQNLGLIPTAKEGGKRVGDSISHSIEPGGRFARVVEELVNSGWALTLSEAPPSSGPACDSSGTENRSGARRSGKRTKYTCAHGDVAVWARAGAEVLCGRHLVRMEPAKAPGTGGLQDEKEVRCAIAGG